MSAQAVMEVAPDREVAKRLTDQLLENFFIHEQPTLFDAREPHEIWKDTTVVSIQAKNPDKIVLPANLVNEYRIMAAFLGAGFHPSQYEDVMLERNDPLEVGRLMIGMFYGVRNSRVKAYMARSNLMTDEVMDTHLFTQYVPTTWYDSSTDHYVTNPHDLRTIMALDYRNLKTCREDNLDLLYERED